MTCNRLLMCILGWYSTNNRKALPPYCCHLVWGIGEKLFSEQVFQETGKPVRSGWGSVTGVQLWCHIGNTAGLPHLGSAWPVGSESLFLGLDSIKECYGLGGSDGKHVFLTLLEVVSLRLWVLGLIPLLGLGASSYHCILIWQTESTLACHPFLR